MLRLTPDRLYGLIDKLADVAIGIVHARAKQHLKKRRAEDQDDDPFQRCNYDRDQQHAGSLILQWLRQVLNVQSGFYHGPIIPQRPTTAEN